MFASIGLTALPTLAQDLPVPLNPCLSLAGSNGQAININSEWTTKPNPNHGILHTGGEKSCRAWVGIGTENPNAQLTIKIGAGSGTKALSVLNNDYEDVFRVLHNGTVWATDVNVRIHTNFPDYVFKQDYSLMPLTELGTYIAKHKHLPNIPKAEEVEKTGLSLGEMQIKQLEKIEELTLYIIAQEKRIKALENK